MPSNIVDMSQVFTEKQTKKQIFDHVAISRTGQQKYYKYAQYDTSWWFLIKKMT